MVDVLYQILNRRTSVYESLEERTRKVAEYYRRENGEDSIRHIPVTELIAPDTLIGFPFRLLLDLFNILCNIRLFRYDLKL